MTDWARYHGSEDMDLQDRLDVRKILRKMGHEDVKMNMFMVEFSNQRLRILPEVMAHEKDDIVEIHRPDIIFWEGEQPIVIEIDGAVHRGGRKDQRRNAFYERHAVPYVILNKEDLHESGLAWDEFIKEKLGAMD